jgi:hypothetical protein
MSSKNATRVAEGAVLGTLTALIYTFQVIFGVGSAISFLSVIPLTYGLSNSWREWIRITIVAMVFVFLLNGVGAFLFFVLFILPMSLSVFLKSSGISTFVASAPFFGSLVLMLSKFGWIAGFYIPSQLENWWILLAFIFCVTITFIFSKITFMVLRPFDFQPTLKISKFKTTILVSSLNLIIVLYLYGFSTQSFFTLAFITPLMALEPLKHISVKTEKVVVYTFNIFRNRFT